MLAISLLLLPPSYPPPPSPPLPLDSSTSFTSLLKYSKDNYAELEQNHKVNILCFNQHYSGLSCSLSYVHSQMSTSHKIDTLKEEVAMKDAMIQQLREQVTIAFSHT